MSEAPRLFTSDIINRAVLTELAEARAWRGYCPNCGEKALSRPLSYPGGSDVPVYAMGCQSCETLVLLGKRT